MKKIVSITVCALAVAAGVGLLPHGTARADFNANNLMDDYILDRVDSMDAGQIDTFLNSFPNSCISTNHGYAAADVTGYSPSGGFTYGSNVSAGTIIYHAAQAYGLNPQVILATLQKEQSLVSGGSSICGDSHAYNAAMGYDCPDGGSCPAHASTTGFSQQVIHGAWLLRFGEQRSEGNTAWAEVHGSWDNSDDPPTFYGGPMTEGIRARVNGGSTAFYDGYTTIDSTAVHMDTGATASLYWYTPHFPGNQNFETIFQTWFGPTTGQGFERVISDNTGDTRQWVVYGGIKQYLPDAQTIFAWNLENTSLITMPAAQLAAIPSGPALGRLTILNTGPSTIYFMDNGQRHKVSYPEMFNAWNFSGQVISSVSPGLFTQPSAGSDLTYAVKDPASSTYYMLDGANNSGQTVLRQYQDTTVMAAWEGSSSVYTAISSDYFATINTAIGATLTSTKVQYGTSLLEITAGTRVLVNASVFALYPGTAQNVSAATLARLPLVGGQGMTQLIKSYSNPTVYLVDGGKKYQILYPDTLTAWSAPGEAISSVGDGFLSLIPAGSPINGYLADSTGQLYVMDKYKTPVPASLDAAYRNSGPVFNASAGLLSLYPTSGGTLTGVIKASTAPTVYLLDASGKRRPMEWYDKVWAWGGFGDHAVTALSDYIVNSMGLSTSASTFVSDGTTNYLLDGGKKWTVTSGIKTDWGFGTPQTYSDGTLNRIPTGGALDNKIRDNQGAYYYIRGGTAYATADPNIAQAWGLTTGPVLSSRAVVSNIRVFMLTRFVRSSVNGDNRTFVVDSGNWYTVDSNQFANLGGAGAPVMALDPAFAPNTISAWASVVVKSSAGTYYVIDGGGKRYFGNQQILDQWTNFETLSTPTVTDGFLALLPTRGWIERAIKGSDPSVYSAENGMKRHVLYPGTYQQFYAPFITVTDVLINAMPTGPDIN